MNAPTTLTVITTNSNANSCGLSVGLGRFELPTFGPPVRLSLANGIVKVPFVVLVHGVRFELRRGDRNLP